MSLQHEKKTKSGKMLEVDFYPVFNNGSRLPVRAPKSKRSTEEQQKYNRAQATKKLIRLVNTNFTEEDFYISPSFKPEFEPTDEAAARKEINNFFRRLKRFRAREADKADTLLTEALEELKKNPKSKVAARQAAAQKELKKQFSKELKYIYCIEKANKWHFHLFVTGAGMTKKQIDEIWGRGKVQNEKYDPENFGPEGAAAYMAKDPKGKKSFAYSKNLKKPKQPKPKLRNIARKRYEQMATVLTDDRDYWEKKYKGYRFLRCYSRLNPYNGHYYISLVMYQSASTPLAADFLTEGDKETDWLNEQDYVTEAY